MRLFSRLKSLEMKFLAFLIPPLLVAVVGLSLAFGLITLKQSEKTIHGMHHALADKLAAHLTRYFSTGPSRDLDEAVKLIVLDHALVSVTVFDSKGARLAHAASEPRPSHIVELVRPISVTDMATNTPHAVASLRLEVDHDRPHTIALLGITNQIIVTTVMVLIVILGVVYLNRRLVGAPLNLLIEAIRRSEENAPFRPLAWDSDDEIGRVISAFNDAQRRTQRDQAFLRRSQKLLQDSEFRFRAIAEAIPTPLVIEWVKDGAVLYANVAARDTLCRGAEVLPDQLLNLIFAVPQDREKFFDALHRGIPVDGQQALLVRPDASRFWASLAARRLDLDGKRAILCAVQDISDHKEAEIALQGAREAADQANAAKDMFLANTGHEIRTPLNAILGLSRLALATDLTREQWEHLHRIETAAHMLLGLVDDVLDFTKMGAETVELRNEPFLFTDVMNGLVAIHGNDAEVKGLSLAVERSGTIPPVLKGDAVRLARVLNNLLDNAIKFTDRGGVVLSAHGESAGPDTVRIAFSVRDSGIGMDPAKVSRLFDPFVQADPSQSRKYQGTGLGLAIVRAVVEEMDSHVTVQTAPGEGSTFSFSLDFATATEAEAEYEQSRPATQSLSGKRVLLVEDNEINRIVAQKILQRAGAAIEPAENGLAALAAVEVGADRFDMVLMDLQMPEMDGHEATIRLRERFSADALPIVALTAHAHADERQRCLDEGMNDYLTKPIDPDVLVATLARIMNGDASAAASPPKTVKKAEPARPDGPATEDLPGLDVADAMSRMGGDMDLFKELLQMFHGIYADGIGPIRSSLENGDKEEARRAAHSLKGVAGNISASALHKAAAQLELALREEHDADEIEQRMVTVEAELAPVLETTARFV